MEVPATSSLYPGVVVPIPTFPVPLGLIKTLPVELYVDELPKTKSALFVVEILPLPSTKVDTFAVDPEIDAVGVPELIFKTLNLALVVAVPPTKRSTVEFNG